MNPYDQLTWFSIVLIGLWIVTILFPYLRGRAHLFSAWNFFLVGSIVFVGLSNLTLTQEWDDTWGRYNRFEISELMQGLAIFYATVYLVYYFVPLGTISGKAFLYWPRLNRRSLIFFALVCVGSTAFFYLPMEIPVLSQFAKQFALKSFAFGIVLVFVAWFRDRANVFLLVMLGLFLLYSLVFSITVGGGRRTFLAAIAGIPLGIYWLHFRKEKKLKVIGLYSLAGVLLLFLVVAYGEIRHRGRGETRRDFTYAIESIRMLPTKFFSGDGKQLLGQHSTECSMLTRRAYANQPEPFAVAKFILLNPVPRSLWPEKPVGLGYSLPKIMASRTRATWGPGVVGHAFHEGSLWFLVFYGTIFAGFVRFADELMARQPENPILIGTLVSTFPHIVGWVRGDIGTFSLQIIAGILAAIFIYFLLWIYGKGAYIRLKNTETLSLGEVVDKDRKQLKFRAG